MKVKKLSLALCMTLAAVLCAACCFAAFTQPDCASAAAGNYYSSITATSGTQLLGQLHDLIVTTHTYYTSYGDVKAYSKNSDPGSSSNTVLEFYTHSDILNSNWDKSGGWNREHVWAQSISNGLWGTSGAGSDMHHIRPSEKDINNHRGNKKYGEVSNGTAEYTSVSNILGGYSDSKTFEPLDFVKGDVARIVMYVYTHYNKASNVGGTTDVGNKTYGNLPVTNVITASNESTAWALLLKWNKLDPVDEIERTRNEYVYTKQGNRNPFIDNESYADAIWGNGSVETAEVTGITLTPSSTAVEIGKTVSIAVSVKPSGAPTGVVWSSSNTSVATVANGVITGKSAGTATITAVSASNSSVSATVTVTVRTASSSGDNGAIDAFVDSVSDVDGAKSLQDKHAAIVDALNNYNALTETEKQDSSVKQARDKLTAAVNAYNSDADARNGIYSSATKACVIAATSTMFAVLALAYIFKFTGSN